MRITYKAEGDGFQCDALCQEGYTYNFYYRNQPAPKKYLDQGHSPLHARVMWLFDGLKDKYHQCGMDNLYISAKFLAAALKHKNKVLVTGLCCKGGRGFKKTLSMCIHLSDSYDEVMVTLSSLVLFSNQEQSTMDPA